MPDLVTDGDNLGDHLATRSFKTIKGTDIASATNITIGTSGNTFDVTGTTTIQHFDNANWVVGSTISLQFDGAVTLTHNAGTLSGNQANILLSGDVNFTTSAGDILTFLLHDSTSWQEISRNTIGSLGGTMTSHIIPDTNDTYDIGSAEYKIRDLYVADNSLWVGDDHKIEIQGGKMKFKKRKKNNVPSAITNASGNASGALTSSGKGSLTLMTLNDWVQYGRSLGGALANARPNDIYGSEVSGDWDSDNATIPQTEIDEKAPTASPTFTGTTSASALTTSGLIISNGNIQMGTGAKITNIKNLQHEISTSGVDIDFSEDQLQTMSIASNTTFTTTNRAVGLSKTIRIITDGTTRTLSFPSDWKFIGAKPTEQAASKTGILTLTNFGTTDAYIVAAYAVEE